MRRNRRALIVIGALFCFLVFFWLLGGYRGHGAVAVYVLLLVGGAGAIVSALSAAASQGVYLAMKEY